MTEAQILQDLAAILAGAGGYHVTRTAPVKKVAKKTIKHAVRKPYTCYDAWSAGNLPSGADAYLGYVGAPPNNFEEVKVRFPRAHVIPITINHTYLASFYDMEPGGGNPGYFRTWFEMCVDHGIHRPGGYASKDNNVAWAAVNQVEYKGVRPRKFCADWTGRAHIPRGFNACQYLNTPTYDVSLLGPRFFD